MARSRSYGRAFAARAPLLKSCSRAGGGPRHRLPTTGSKLGQRERRERRRLIGEDRRQASDQAEPWSLVTRPVTRLSTISAAQALYAGAFAAAQLRNPGLGQQAPEGARGDPVRVTDGQSKMHLMLWEFNAADRQILRWMLRPQPAAYWLVLQPVPRRSAQAQPFNLR
jgi:hypothetical protein